MAFLWQAYLSIGMCTCFFTLPAKKNRVEQTRFLKKVD
jgi:hypothetical protein